MLSSIVPRTGVPFSRHLSQLIKDNSSKAIDRDYTKCIYCDACVSACEMQGFNVYDYSDRAAKLYPQVEGFLPLSESLCVGCGQCTTVCPVGCLVEKDHLTPVLGLLKNKPRGKKMVATIAPAVRVGIADVLGVPASDELTNRIFGVLRRVGFDIVFDVCTAADVTIMEEASELVHRLTTEGNVLPMFTSCCPAWFKAVEHQYPEIIPHLSSTRSPQAIMASMVKSIYADIEGINPEDLTIVSIMPCTAKKEEIAREELAGETDYVLTTRELVRLLELEAGGIESLLQTEPSHPDSIFGQYSGAGVIFGASGGVMEAALRTAYHMVTGENGPDHLLEFAPVRGVLEDESLKEATVHIGGIDINVLCAHGGETLLKVAEGLADGDPEYTKYHFIEVMTCPGGCVAGGGQPKARNKSHDQSVTDRMAGLYDLDKKMTLRRSHENPDVQAMYTKYVGKPYHSEKAHKLFHTYYTDRKKK